MRKRRYLMICVCMMMLYFTGCGKDKDEIIFEATSNETVKVEDTLTKAENGAEDENMEASGRTAEEQICIYVCGAVVTPGVYEFIPGARVAEAIMAAGGMTEEAAETYWNQAAVLEDGQKIYVPTKEEAAEEAESQSRGQIIEQENKINLNTASN